MLIDWQNSSDSLIAKMPFSLKLDGSTDLINQITIEDKVQSFDYVSTESNDFEGFILNLDTPLKPHHKLRISLDFKTKPNEFFREKMLFYADDIPLLHYFENGKFNPYYQVHANYQVQLTYPQDFEIATTGKIVSSASSNQQISVETEAHSVPSYGFVLLKDIVLKEAESSGVKIRSFYFEADSKWGTKLLEYSQNIIRFFVDKLGFYPQPTLTIIPGYPSPYGGWPVCPNVVGVHRGIDQKKAGAETHAHWIMAHEIGHQYWGFNYILEPLEYPQWLGVGMGIHTDKLYAEQYIPDFDYNQYFSKSYLKAIQQGDDTTIMQTVESLNKQNFDWNNAILHDKAYYVLQMLAYEIGEEAFWQVQHYCLENFKGVNVTLELFKKECERISQRDLDQFFHTWFFTNDYLEYQIASVQTELNNQLYQNEIKIDKIGKAQISHLEIELILQGDKKQRVLLDGKKQSEILKITTEEPLNKIRLDPDLKLLLVNRKAWKRDN
ncbi:MAG: hypothetical protein R6U84_09535 [Candidatus Cloacimonadales bacterium]